MTAIVRNSKNEPKMIEVENLSVSIDTDGIMVQVKNPTRIFEELQKDGFGVCMVGSFINILNARSIYCY